MGLADVDETALSVSVEHPTFEEWWEPFTLGVGPAGAYVAGLDPERRDALREQCRADASGGAVRADRARLDGLRPRRLERLLVMVIWMFVRAHRQLRSRTRRWLLYPVFAVLALAAIGGGYETVGEAADAKAYPMPGQLIDVGGHRLHLNCTGSGSPTVVLEPGGGEMSSNLGWIAPAVARDTRVCVYDRAGRGWSEPADTPQDATQIATDLHTLLQRAHVPGPYVLAGHSFGGLYVLTFAARYPDEVAGMVLIDSTAPASADETADSIARRREAPTTSWVVSPRWFRPRLDSVWAACTRSSPPAACRRSPRTRCAPAPRPPATSAARSTSTSRPTPRCRKPHRSTTSPTSRWSS